MRVKCVLLAVLLLSCTSWAAGQEVPEVEQVLFSVKDLARSEQVYTQILGFNVRARGTGPAPTLERLWDLPPNTRMKWALLEKVGAPESVRIRLVEFSPTSPRSRYEYREQDGGYMDFHICVENVQAAYERLREAGFTAMSEPIPWSGGAGQAGDLGVGKRTWNEAFMHGFDGEGVTLIPGRLFDSEGKSVDCAIPEAGQFTPIRSINFVVSDLGKAYAFYHGLFGWEESVKKRYEAFGPAMEQMVGLPKGTVARAIFLARPSNSRVPWLCLSEFDGTERIDLSARNAPPFRGFVGTTFRTSNLHALYQRFVAAGVTIVQAPIRLEEEPYGARAFSIRGPDGVFIELVERGNGAGVGER